MERLPYSTRAVTGPTAAWFGRPHGVRAPCRPTAPPSAGRSCGRTRRAEAVARGPRS